MNAAWHRVGLLGLLLTAAACARSGVGSGDEVERPDWDGGQAIVLDVGGGDVAVDAGMDSRMDAVADIEPDTPAVCGNGVVEDGEECDDGRSNSDVEPDACRTDCRFASCGDGVIDADELCDDGNREDFDGCSSDCLAPAVPCEPCLQSEDCGRGIDRCVRLPDGLFCGRGCRDDADCGEGLACEDAVTVAGDLTPQCVPTATVCSECFDRDGDGYGIGLECLGFDCDDDNPNINPGAVEICDDLDNNCNAENDEVCPPDLIVDAETVELDGEQLYDHVIVRNGGVVRVRPQENLTRDCRPGGAGCLRIEARIIEVLEGSAMDASGAGACTQGQGPEAGFGRGLVNAGPAGGGYGGGGGFGPGITGGAPYGAAGGTTIQMGSPGGSFSIVERGFDAVCDDLVGLVTEGGSGGGCLELLAPDIVIDGSLLANGEPGQNARTGAVVAPVDAGAGGSGGGVRLAGQRIEMSDSAVISARGGRGGVGGTYRPGGDTGETCIGNGAGGGGGGRVKIDAGRLQLQGAINVRGGQGGEGPQNDATDGGDGTFFIE